MHRAALIVLALLSCAQAHAQIYKWADVEGRIHYTEVPPTDRPYQQFSLRTLPPSPPPAPTPARTPEVPDQVAVRQANCEAARTNLAMLESDQEVITTGRDGEKVVVDAGRRQTLIAQARKDADYFCTP